MSDLYKYGEILGLTNMSIILSITVISVMLYAVFNEASLLITFFIYSSELIIYYMLKIYDYKDIINTEYLSIIVIFYLMKLVLLILVRRRLGFQVEYNMLLIIANTANLVIIDYSREFSILLIVFTNIVILKQFIFNRIGQLNLEFKKNKKILKENKNYIEQWDKSILQEYDLQNKYKDEIVNLNNKISKSIAEADIPIFLLDINKEYIYSNQSFEKIIIEDNIKKEDFNILSFIQSKFTDGKEMIDIIHNIANKKYENITVKSVDKKVYRFICTSDTIEEQSVIIGILSDITKSRLIQNKLRDSEERYKNLMDILNEGIVIHDEFHVSYINNKALEILNIQQLNSDIKVEDIKESIIKKYRYNFLANLENVVTEAGGKISNKLETKNGKIIEFITTILNINESKMFISIIIDITEFENALTDIEQSEKTYKLLLHTLPEGIMIIDSKSKKQSYLNESMMGILKRVGLEKLNESIKKYLEECEYGKFKKFTIKSKEKTDIAIAIIDREEEDLLVIARILDSEYKVQKIKEELNSISQKSKFKTEFLYNIVNDIKEPINTIYGINSNIIKNKDKYRSTYIENYTRLLKQNCYRLIRLSNNIEEVKNIENGMDYLELRKCDIVKLIKHIVQVSQRYADGKHITMKVHSNVNRKIVNLDVNKIEKIILNILSNAIKFTDSGGKIELNINVYDENVHISIKDTGIGIPKDDIETIFGYCEQVDRTLSRGTEGTGVGLYLVKKLSEIHKISIEVDSELGKGSEFKISISDNSEFTGLQIDSRIYSNLSDKEKIDIEFSDIYFDISS